MIIFIVKFFNGVTKPLEKPIFVSKSQRGRRAVAGPMPTFYFFSISHCFIKKPL